MALTGLPPFFDWKHEENPGKCIGFGMARNLHLHMLLGTF